MRICIMGTMGIPHVQYGPGLMKKRQKRGGGAFLPNFQECLILAYIHIIGTSDVPNV